MSLFFRPAVSVHHPDRLRRSPGSSHMLVLSSMSSRTRSPSCAGCLRSRPSPDSRSWKTRSAGASGSSRSGPGAQAGSAMGSRIAAPYDPVPLRSSSGLRLSVGLFCGLTRLLGLGSVAWYCSWRLAGSGSRHRRTIAGWSVRGAGVKADSPPVAGRAAASALTPGSTRG